MSKLFGEMKRTARGFAYYEGVDSKGEKISLQKSSLAGSDYVWLGVDNVRKVKDTSVYPPTEVEITRMHLSQEQALELSAYLQYFGTEGELPVPEEFIDPDEEIIKSKQRNQELLKILDDFTGWTDEEVEILYNTINEDTSEYDAMQETIQKYLESMRRFRIVRDEMNRRKNKMSGAEAQMDEIS